MDAGEFFSLAEMVVRREGNTCGEEICLRTAINRVHYGVFHTLIKQYHITIPLKETGKCHRYVGDLVDDEVKNPDITSTYHHLENLRNDADYYIDDLITKQKYQEAIKYRDLILGLIKENPDFLRFDKEEEENFNQRKKGHRR